MCDPAVLIALLARKLEDLESERDGRLRLVTNRTIQPLPSRRSILSHQDKPEVSYKQLPSMQHVFLPDPGSPIHLRSFDWDNRHPPTLTYHLEGPKAVHEHNGAFEDPTSRIYTTQDTRVSKKLVPFEEEERTQQRCIVISRKTNLILSLDLSSGSNKALPFDSIRVPVTPSVKRVIDPGARRVLSLDIRLEDASSGNLLKACETCQGGAGEWVTFVDFHVDQNIIDLQQGKVCLRFTLPCSCIDVSGPVFRYRVYVGLEEPHGGKIVQILPDTFEVMHSVESAGLGLEPLPEWPMKDHCCPLGNSTVSKETESSSTTSQHTAPCACKGGSSATWHSFCSILDGCFEPIFSHTFEAGDEGRIPLRTFRDSQCHRTLLYLLPPMDRRRLKAEIREEKHRLERRVRQNPRAIAKLQREYDLAGHLLHFMAPIFKLPTELLSEVFLITLDQRKHSIDPIMLVCRRWKEVFSSIWGSLHLRTWTPVEKVNNVNNGGRWLLDVTIDPLNDETARRPASGAEPYAALALANATASQRWRELTLLSLPSEGSGQGFSLAWTQQLGGALKGQLRSLNIEVQKGSPLFLDQLLCSISAIPENRLTDIQLRSPHVVSYLAQPSGWNISNHLTSFKAILSRTNDTFDILQHFHRLEIFEATRLRLVSPTPGVELRLATTLRRMELKSVSIGWMNGREFSRLQQCTIISPPEPGVIPVVNLPQCTVLHFEGSRFDPIKAFRTSSGCSLILHSNQWNGPRGNVQLHSLWGMEPSEIVLRPVSLHLRLACGRVELLCALLFLPELTELVLELDRPTAPGRTFLMSLLPQSTRGEWCGDGGRKGGKALGICPSLKVLGLKYRRWFRPSELNNMLILVAMVSVRREPSRGMEIWVKGMPCQGQERVEVVDGRVSAFTLRSLGCLRVSDSTQVSSEVVEDINMASLATLNPSYATFRYSESITYLSRAVYPSLFRKLRTFTLTAQIDQETLLRLLPHFEHLEQLSVPKLVLESPKPDLSLFRTLKRMHLGETSLHWMTGCTFVQLEHLRIDKIDDAGFSTDRSIRMPACISASISPSPIRVLNAFELPKLDHLHLSMPCDGTDPPSRRWGEGLYASMRQFNLRSACFEGFDNPLVFRSALAMQYNLEVLEIIYDGSIPGSEMSELFNVLTEPNTMDTTSAFDNIRAGTRSQRSNRDAKRRAPLCPNLKTVMIKLGETAPSKRPGMVRIGQRFMMQRKKKHRHLERCQFWWERDGWDGTPSKELIGSTQPSVVDAKARPYSRNHLPATMQSTQSI